LCNFTPVLTPELRDAMIEIGREMMTNAALEMVFKGHIGGLSDRRDGLANTPGRRDQFHIVTSGTALFSLLSYAQVMREIQNAA
jgi:hypothetical protein